MILELDTQLFLFLHNFALDTPELIALVFFAAQPLVFISIIAGLLVVFWYYDKKPGFTNILPETLVHMGLVGGSTVVASATARIIKLITGRARPFLSLEINPLFKYGGFDSFPSEHSMVAFAAAGAMLALHPKLGIIALAAAVGVGFGRIMAGVHYPLDVAVGATLGLVIGVLVVKFAKPLAWKIYDLTLKKIARQL